MPRAIGLCVCCFAFLSLTACAAGEIEDPSVDGSAHPDGATRADASPRASQDARAVDGQAADAHGTGTDVVQVLSPDVAPAPIADSGSPPPPPPPAPSGGYCSTCATDAECGTGGRCLLNRSTGETLCGQDCTAGACPSGAVCASITISGAVVHQCVPSSGSCVGVTPPPPPPPVGDAGTPAPSGDLQHCVDVINSYRAMVGSPPVTRASDLEAYAAEGAQADSVTGTAHGHFRATSGGGIAFAENELPGWPLGGYGSIQGIMDAGSAQMWAEGPGGGHYENMRNPSYTRVGCGVYVMASGNVWVVQDFR